MKTKVLTLPFEKAKGVIGRDSLDPDEIYIFTDINESSFHMQGVHFPLDIAFLDDQFGIVEIATMEPQIGKAKAPREACYAVEATYGFFNSNKLKVGDFFTEVFNKLSQKEL